VLSAATMGLLVFTIIEAPTYGWTAARSLTGFAGSAVLLAAFIVRERFAAYPMLDVRIFRNLRVSAASGAVAVSFITLFGFIFLISQYFQFVRGYGPLSTGVRLLPVALSVGVGSVVGTQLAVRAGTKLIVTIGLVATALFYGWVAATTTATLSYRIIVVQMVVLYGLGMGLTSAPATESIMGAVSQRMAGLGSAVNDSTRLIGGNRRRSRDRQRLRVRFRVAAGCHHAGRCARPGRGGRAPVGRCRLHRRRQRQRARPPGARASVETPVHQRIRPRTQRQLPCRRWCPGRRSRPRSPVPPRPPRTTRAAPQLAQPSSRTAVPVSATLRARD
jgi:hypothetical protein